jgi:hypothetical protein
MKQEGHGNVWLWTLLVIQFAFHVFYIIMDIVKDLGFLTNYHYFNLIIVIELMVFNIFVLRNAISRFLIEEFKIAAITLGIVNIYSTIRYCISIVTTLKDKEGDLWTDGDHLARLVFILDIIGLGINLLLLPLYIVVTYYNYNAMRNFIVLHLDGNRSMWENFTVLTLTRGILKLDVLTNLLYFTCFGMILK